MDDKKKKKKRKTECADIHGIRCESCQVLKAIVRKWRLERL